jgi:hypothetical protein
MKIEIDKPNSTARILDSTWESYLDWSTLSRNRKRRLKSWRVLVLALGLGGAVLETMAASPHVPSMLGSTRFDLFGLLGFIFLALAAFFSREVLGGKPEREWVGARSVAESLKSESYKYVTGVSPYDQNDRDHQLAEKRRQITDSANSLRMIPKPADRASKAPPKDPMTVDEYVTARLEDQIDPAACSER